jgi:hypothetical protein
LSGGEEHKEMIIDVEDEEQSYLFLFESRDLIDDHNLIEDRDLIEPRRVARKILEENLSVMEYLDALYAEYPLIEELFGGLANYRESVFQFMNWGEKGRPAVKEAQSTLTVISDRSETDKYQKKFMEILCKGRKPVKRTIGFQSGAYEYDAHYIEEQGIWYCFEDAGTRYWNTFCLGDPKNPQQSLLAVAEINFPFEFNRRCGGVFLSDGKGTVYVGHRGIKRKGLSKELFFQEYQGDVREVRDEDNVNGVAVITNFDSPDMLRDIGNFVKQVKKIKDKTGAKHATK